MPPYGNNIASILQGARGLRGSAQRGQPPDIQATLASLRQQLYGMPQQGVAGPGGPMTGGGPYLNPGGDPNAGRSFGQTTGGPAGGGTMQPNLGGDTLQQPRPQPAWQQLAALGLGGQGSPAANRAALLAAQAGQPGGAPGIGGAQQGDGTVMTDGGLPAGAGGAAANVGAELQNVNGGGLQGGPRGGVGPAPPGATWRADPSMADTGGGMWVGASGQPVDWQGRSVEEVLRTGGGPGPFAAQTPASAQTLPATMTTAPPNLKPTFQGAMTPGLVQPQMPAQQRIQQARQGIRQGVQRALRKPATTTGTAAPASGRK